MSIEKVGFLALGAIAVIVSAAAILINSIGYNKKLNEAQSEIAETVTVDLQDYFGGYMNESATKVKTLDKSVSDLEEQITKTYLTEEQLNTLTSAVIEQITPEVIKDITSVQEQTSSQAITQLEQQISEQVLKTIEETGGTLKETDKQAMVDAISLIVETNILKSVTEKQAVSDMALETLESAINDKIEKIKTTVNDYEARIREMETKIGTLSSDSANADTVAKMEKDLYSLKRTYEAFSVNSNNTTTIIETKIDEKTSEIDGNITALKESLATGIAGVQEELGALEEELNDNVEALEAASATKTELEAQKTALQEAIAAAEQAAKTKSDEDIAKAQEALNEAITKAGTSASDELKKAKETLEASISGNKSEIDTSLEAVKTALGNQSQTVDGKIEGINTEIEGLNTSITGLSSRIGVNETSIADLQKKTTDNSALIATANADIETANTNIETAQGKITDLETAKGEMQTALDGVTSDLATYKTTNAADIETAQIDASIESIYTQLNKLASKDSASQELKDALTTVNAVRGNAGATNEQKVAALEAAETALSNNITGIEGNITSAKAEIDANKQKITENESAIAEANNAVSEAKAGVDKNKQDIDANKEAIERLSTDVTNTINNTINGMSNGSKTTYEFTESDAGTTVTITVPTS